jgi:hypothetical protein
LQRAPIALKPGPQQLKPGVVVELKRELDAVPGENDQLILVHSTALKLASLSSQGQQ